MHDENMTNELVVHENFHALGNMPTLTSWAERDFDIDALEKYCMSTRRAVEILAELWITNGASLSNLATMIEQATNESDDQEILNNYLEEKVMDRVTQSLFQYGKGVGSGDPQHMKSLRRCLTEHDQKLPNALIELRQGSEKLSQITAELTNARKAKTDADQSLLSAIMSKSELEKRFTPSAVGGVGGNALPASAVNILKKCDERIKTAQANQLEWGEKLTELREQLDEITKESAQSRKENLQIIENVEKKKLNSIGLTANEVLSLQMILSQSLSRETEGIIETDLATDKGTLNHSIASSIESVRSSLFSTIHGFDWVDRILKTEPSERSLFTLQNIAEEVTLHESQDDVKITDLEQEIERLKQQIFELQEGKGSFADRLAADYLKPQTGNRKPHPNSPTGAVRAIPQFSLPLPLKNDCYDPKFWRGFAIEENHSEMTNLIQLPISPDNDNPIAKSTIISDHEWDVLAYEQILLGYFEITSRYAHILSGSQWNKLKAVVQMSRLKMKIPTKTHEGIVELLLPDTVAVQDEISPLDLRFRVLRMIIANDSSTSRASEWMKRQIALLDLAVRCWIKEDLTGYVTQTISPIMTVILGSSDCIESEVLIELLESMTTFCEEKSESPSLSTPRGVYHQLISRMWKMCVDINEETGLNSDTPYIAAFLHNFLTARQYPYHPVWLGVGLWEAVVGQLPALPASVAKQVNVVTQPGDKWLDKVCGDAFWFGSRHENSCASPVSKSSSVSKMERQNSSVDSVSDDASRTIAFDLAYLNIFTCAGRDNIVNSLCDYRSRLEPESLEIAIEIFRNVMNRSNTMVPLYMWPSDSDYSTFLDAMSEFFISESAHSVCNRLIEPTKYLDAVSVARAHASDEARGIWISEVSDAIWKVIFEFKCEMDVYSIAWKRFGLSAKHSLIWCKGLQSRIRAVVELINRDDDLWMTDRVPPNGQDLLAVLQVWQRVSGDGGLTDVIRPKISRSLGTHLDKVERDSLPAVLHSNLTETWEPTRKPTILHSTKCVDLWTTIFTSIQACIDAASAQLSMATCSQMIVRCVEKYCDNAKEGFVYDVGYAYPLYVKSKRVFNRLIKSQEDDTELVDIFKHKKKRKNRLFKKDNAVASGGEESDGEQHARKPSDTGMNLIGDNHLFLSDYITATSKWVSHQDTSLMVRLHDFAFSFGELDKARDTLKESIEKEHARLCRLYQSHTKNDAPNSTDLNSLPKLSHESVSAMMEAIENGISEASSILTNSGNLVTTYLGMNMVFLFLKDELFEQLYMPTPRESPLSRITRSFDHNKLTIFTLMAPQKWRKDLCRTILANFVYAWVYVVTDMASRGRMFKESDSGVMNNDLTALHELADQLRLKDDEETQEILRSVGCLPVYVSGSTPAEFKANCERALTEPTEKSKGKSRLTTAKPPPMNNSSYGKKSAAASAAYK